MSEYAARKIYEQIILTLHIRKIIMDKQLANQVLCDWLHHGMVCWFPKPKILSYLHNNARLHTNLLEIDGFSLLPNNINEQIMLMYCNLMNSISPYKIVK